MCRLLETIRVRGGELQHIDYHNSRVNASRAAIFGAVMPWDLSEIIKMPELDPSVTYRCRFLYAEEPGTTEFIPYVKRIVRKLFVIDCGNFEYSYKYADRSAFEKFRAGIPDPEHSDILLVKNGLITDTSFSNIILYDGVRWYTPAIPLLKGTKRQYYLDHKIIFERDIAVKDLYKFVTARLINAMLDMEDGDDIPVGDIIS